MQLQSRKINFLHIFFVAFSVAIVFCYFLPTSVDAYVSVKGYTKKNGTYVAPYVRSNPNGLKTDNYGYKPSQGTFNKTYGTRGAYWDTPTYYTDPSYYEGQAIYNSNNSASSYSAHASTPSCPVNSYYDGVSSCKCLSGYTASNTACVPATSYCVSKYGYLAGYNVNSNSCECISGAVFNGLSCIYNTSTYQSAATLQTATQTSPSQTSGKQYFLQKHTCVGLNDAAYEECISFALNN
jgi:hypothetical protein